MKRLLLLGFLNTLCLSTLMAQTNIIVLENQTEDEIYEKYYQNPFVNYFIKPNSFKDGSYIFYLDKAKTNIFFEGIIEKGITSGIYYTYNLDTNNGEYISSTKRGIKVENGKFDGEYGFKDIPNKYHYCFEKGEIKKLKVIDPFNHFLSDEEKDTIKAIDTLTISFQKGKIESVNFYNYNSFYNVQPILSSDCSSNTSGLINLTKSQSYYVTDPERNDSTLIRYYKKFNFNDSATNWNKRLSFQYDSLKTLTCVVLESGLDALNRSVYFNLTPVKIKFDKNNGLKYIDCNGKYYFVSAVDENGNEGLRIILNQAVLYFLPDGIFDITNHGNY
ncbi:MAG: hypothetical protein HXX16_09235 [Bacteroidales bacterium]|nr:hypothetical protein [Bacteroidales bacterium]